METKPVEKSEIDLAIEDIKKGNVVSFDNVEDFLLLYHPSPTGVIFFVYKLFPIFFKLRSGGPFR